MENFKKAMVSFIGGLPNSSIYYQILEILEKEEFIDSVVKIKQEELLLEKMNPLQKATYTLLQKKEAELIILQEKTDLLRKEVNKKKDDLANQFANELKSSDPEKFEETPFIAFGGRADVEIESFDVYQKWAEAKREVLIKSSDVNSIKDFFLRVSFHKVGIIVLDFTDIDFRKGFSVVISK